MKSLRVFFYILIATVFSVSCVDNLVKPKEKTYYEIILANKSTHNLTLHFGVDYIQKVELNANSEKVLHLSDAKKQYPEYLFKGNKSWQEIKVYINSQLVKQWNGPARDMNSNVNHFHNYRSWVVSKDSFASKYSGKVTFTITDADLQ